MPIEWRLQDIAEDMEAKGDDGVAWYKRVTGQVVPVLMNVERYTKEKPAAETTQDARRSAIARFSKWLPKPILESVDRRKAGIYVSKLVDEGLAPKSVNSQVSHLSAYWRWLEKRGIVSVNPWTSQNVPNTVQTKRLPWSTDEVVHLINSAPTKLLKHAVAISALAGLRAGEVVKLKVSDCSDGELVVLVGKSKAATRKVPIHSQLVEIINSRINGKAPDDYLLPELRGNAKALVKRFAAYRQRLLWKERRPSPEDVSLTAAPLD